MGHIAGANSGNLDLKKRINELEAEVEELKDNLVFDNYQTPTFTLWECTGDISTNAKVIYSKNPNSRFMQICGRIIISNFTRTAPNPGVLLTLPFDVNKEIPSLCIGYVKERDNEHVQLGTALDKTKNSLYIRTTETYTNAANGTMTFIVPLTTLYIP